VTKAINEKNEDDIKSRAAVGVATLQVVKKPPIVLKKTK